MPTNDGAIRRVDLFGHFPHRWKETANPITVAQGVSE
jgi:hypothetical protein